jgi:hypothetical protein
MARLQIVYLVVRSDGDVRVAKRPRVAPDEVAIAVQLTFPDGWGKVVKTIDVTMPEPPTAEQAVATDGD